MFLLTDEYGRQTAGKLAQLKDLVPVSRSKDRIDAECWPIFMLLSEIAQEEDEFIRDCRIIYYSDRTTDWQKQYARDNANWAMWQLEHPWVVPKNGDIPSPKVIAAIKRIKDSHLKMVRPFEFIEAGSRDDEHIDPLDCQFSDQLLVWPEKMRLSEIAQEEDAFIRTCRLIRYSERTTPEEKQNAVKYANRHARCVSLQWNVAKGIQQIMLSASNMMRSIAADYQLDKINLDSHKQARAPKRFPDEIRDSFMDDCERLLGARAVSYEKHGHAQS